MTAPVHKLAQLLLYETVYSALQTKAADDVPFQLDDVDRCLRLAAFGGPCRSLRFKEEVVVKGVTVAAESAGRTFGGAMWSISRLTESVLYVSSVALGTGSALPPCGLSLDARRSRFAVSASGKDVSLLVVTAAPGWSRHQALLAPPVAVRASDVTAQMDAVARAVSPSSSSSSSAAAAGSTGNDLGDHLSAPTGTAILASAIREVWRQKGNVLVAADSGARLLETVLGLERSDALGPASEGWVAVLSTLGPALLGNAAALRDWTVAPPGENPFRLARVRVATNVAELGQLPPPGCVIASSADLEAGFARQLLPIWAADARNAVILTSAPTSGSLADRLLRGEAMRRAAAASGKPASLQALRAIDALAGPLPALPSASTSASSASSGSSSASSSAAAEAAAMDPVALAASEDAFQAMYAQSRKRELTGQDREDWEAARAARVAAEARQHADAARRRMAEEKARAAAAEEEAAVSRATASVAAAEALSEVDAVALQRAAQARVRLGMAALPREVLARAIADSNSTCPDGTSTLAGAPLTASFGGLEPLGTWTTLGEAMDLTALRESDKAEELRRAGLAAPGAKSSLLGRADTAEAGADAAGAASGAVAAAARPSDAAILAARLSRPDLGGGSSAASAPAAAAGLNSDALTHEARPEATEEVVASVDIKCRVGFLDLSGRSQRAAVAEAVLRARPKRVVVIGGAPRAGASAELDSRAATAAAISAAVGAAVPVLSVADGDSESLGSGAATRTVRLAPELFAGLSFEQVGSAEVALVRGVCAANDDAEAGEGAVDGPAGGGGTAEANVAVIVPDGAGAAQGAGGALPPTMTAIGAVLGVAAGSIGGDGGVADGGEGDVSSHWRHSGYAEEDEDEAAMLVALGPLAGAAHAVPTEPRSVLALRSGLLPLRTIHRAVAAAGQKPMLQPGAVSAGGAAILKSDKGVTLVGVAGDDWDAMNKAVRSLTAAV